MPSAPIFSLRPIDVYAALETGPEGLSVEEAASRLSLYGPNRLHVVKPVSIDYKHLLSQVSHPMALLLWAAGTVALIGGRPVLGAVIWLVVVVNAVFSFWQEYRAERAISSLEKLLPDYSRVLREGVESSLPTSEIVPGDILVLAEGDNIPADARVVEEFGLRVNNAALTGETLPVRKSADASPLTEMTEVERPNLIFAGTSVASGTARAVVYSTGSLTQFGRIARLTQETPPQQSRLQAEMSRITRLFSLAALGIGALCFLWGVTEEGIPWLSAFLLAIGIIVAVIPEGLVPTLTISLAIAVQRLTRRGVLVKSLAMMETVGTVSVICTDKSGTLTQNQMTVREIWSGGRQYRVSGSGYELKGGFSPVPSGRWKEDLRLVLRAAAMCNNSRLLPPSPERPKWSYLGDQTEAALRVLALKGGVDEAEEGRTFPRIHEIPFDARRKRMCTIHHHGNRETAFVKGAPREVLHLCTRIRMEGKDLPLEQELRSRILAANDRYARNALRVLALAYRPLYQEGGCCTDYSAENVEQDLTFLGLAAMMDPPRPEVAEAVDRCRKGGIRWVMITGDYGLTADSLARRIGMLTAENPRILTGAELDRLSDAQLQVLLREEVIFARMAPEHKLRLVAAFQERGDVVAVVGDGVNDAPALRKADVGVAMGISGTDVAREAADLVLTDDNFGAVAHAVEEGRAVFDNLRKFFTYIFASNISEMVPLILSALFDIPMTLTVAQILAIDLGTDLLPGLALGSERPEPDVMDRPPRGRDQPMLDRSVAGRSLWLGLLETVLCYAGFFFVYYWMDPFAWKDLVQPLWLPYEELLLSAPGRTYVMASTVFLAGVVCCQIGNAFACRTSRGRVGGIGYFSNRMLLVSVVLAAAMLLMLIYIPVFNGLFELLPLPPAFWAFLAPFAPAVYFLEWIRKSLVRRGWFARDREIPPPSNSPAGRRDEERTAV
ncbi:MAG: cation-transporting P-type ATPase [Anaerolineales bacterium]|nr:cation-transporting P-type ATPase [Anaerolineales bacterium]